MHLNANTRNEIIAEAKRCDIPAKEALDFAEELIREIVDETFKK